MPTATQALVQQVEDSQRLYYRGFARQDPVAMALAAELRAEALGTWEPEGNIEGGLPTPSEMLDAANRAARGDSAMQAVVQRIGERRRRGNINGPLVKHASVSADEPLKISATFDNSLPAIVYVEGVPRRLFYIRVAAESGQTVCQDDSPLPRKLCRFQPAETGRYVLEVTTEDADAAELLIITN
ncbi:MAG: hypothetical protein AAFY69_13645 [Pseudomonadota bacterium]